MPAQTNSSALSRMHEIQRVTFGISVMMYSALQEVAKCEVSSEGSLAMKTIAEKTLVEVHQTAKQTGRLRPPALGSEVVRV